MAWRRHKSTLFAPASASFRIPMICSSVNRLRFIAGPPRGHPSRADSHSRWTSFRGAGRTIGRNPTAIAITNTGTGTDTVFVTQIFAKLNPTFHDLKFDGNGEGRDLGKVGVVHAF